jgi:hypothetical protein
MAFEPKVTLAAGVELIRPPRPTEGPRRPPPELLRRDATVDLVGPDNTCGFISGLAGMILTLTVELVCQSLITL